MPTDSTTLRRLAEFLAVDLKRSSGSPPSYESNWQPHFGADVNRIEIVHGDKPNTASIWFPALRWNQINGLKAGDRIRIRTVGDDPVTLFSGFAVTYNPQFFGGDDKTKAFERNVVTCMDHRWLLNETSPIFGMFARGPDDFIDYGTAGQAPIENSYTALSGKRAIFNRDGKPNRDPVDLTLRNSSGAYLCDYPLFAAPATAVPWTARQMIRYCLGPAYNRSYNQFPLADPAQIPGLDHADFDRVLNHIVVDTLSMIEAVSLICKHLGHSFREDYDSNGDAYFVFYKIASTTAYTRSSSSVTIRHALHAPDVGEDITAAVNAGAKMLWAMNLSEDVSRVINNPVGLGAPDRFEFTAELVPAWLDADFTPDTSDNNANLFAYEADLAENTDPDALDFFRYYHPRGSQFKRDVGRKWTLNESGTYSAGSYDRGMPFDFASVIPYEYIRDSGGNRNFAPFNRQLLPCLTFDKDTLNSIGIRVDFSFDGGATWQMIPAVISVLPSEAGIYIEEPNLAELSDIGKATISGGDLDGIDLNYFTALADDKVNARSFKDGNWKTRIRITASVQMDQRLRRFSPPSVNSGSPFHHRGIYDFSEKYGITVRTASSTYESSDLPAWNTDGTDKITAHLDAIREANEDTSISGRFTLERLWIEDDGPVFLPGDLIEGITGRSYSLAASYNGGSVYPEIIKVIYQPQNQRQTLITRDLRFTDVQL